MTVLARGVDDVDEFMERLEATGAFVNVLSREERVTDAGQLAAVLESEYVRPRPSRGSRDARQLQKVFRL